MFKMQCLLDSLPLKTTHSPTTYSLDGWTCLMKSTLYHKHLQEIVPIPTVIKSVPSNLLDSLNTYYLL